ncbi:hypothetical protein GC173_11390 [bacterium]|nr:hypothetical protein [bacterium]
MPEPQTDKQRQFIADLVKDIRRLFVAGTGKEEDDFVRWFGGFLNKHRFAQRDVWTAEELGEYLGAISSDAARKLIKALMDVRERMSRKLPRCQVQTGKTLIVAISKAASENGVDAEALDNIIHGVTNGETTSRKNLRREEVIEVLRRVGGETRVFEVQRHGNKTRTVPKKVVGR